MKNDPPDPPSHYHGMDIAFGHLFRRFPEAIMKAVDTQHTYIPVAPLSTQMKALFRATDGCWKMLKDNSQERIIVMEHITQYRKKDLRRILTRKAWLSEEHDLDAIGVIVIPEKISIPFEKETHYILGDEDGPHTSDKNYLLRLDLLPPDLDPKDPGQLLLHLFSEQLERDVAIESIAKLEAAIKDEDLLGEAWTLAYFFMARRFDSDALAELWKRIRPMVTKTDAYASVLAEGAEKGAAQEALQRTANLTLKALNLRFNTKIQKDIEDKIKNQTDIKILEQWFEISLKAGTIEEFRKIAKI